MVEKLAAEARRLHKILEAHVPQKAVRDVWYWLRYGRKAPASDSAIFVRPGDVTHSLAHHDTLGHFRRQNSGRVIGGDWDTHRDDVERNTKLRSCRMRWEQGADWHETPIYKRMLAEIAAGRAPDECRSAEDLDERYAMLDRVFAETRFRGRLLTKEELPDHFRREHGGILVHVARDGTCLRRGGGAHRFAIARILDLPEMPAQVGVVHPKAIEDGHLQRLLQSRHREAA
ncbi:hypothetical protein [Tropicibacter oceani]|uniref:Uncharacterized protein n=1 Tax=Tropicibacter oceani TaxID=3058420 RepID=A0ABY8QKS6_9RHOB|nr:hypothetical protein [Tropicibacter oceani]WGW05225.1 hypothetical protein QF118_06685 [Tropicibacter oceani]